MQQRTAKKLWLRFYREKNIPRNLLPGNIQGNLYVILCEIQEMLALLFGGGDFVFNCVCRVLVGNDIFQNWVNIRYILNFVFLKICFDVDRLPVKLKSRLVKIDDYLKKKSKMNRFFNLCREKKRICANLDNPDVFGHRKIFKYVWTFYNIKHERVKK